MSIDSALEAYEHSRDEAVRELLAGLGDRVPGLSRRLAEADLDPADVTGAQALAGLPPLRKDDLVDRQREQPPSGGLLASDARVHRWFQSPGPLYEPQLEGATWRWEQVLGEAGVDGSSVVLNCFGYHLSPAGAMLEQGAHARGAAVVPGGIGGQDLQVQAIADLGVTAYTGLPSYLLSLCERFAGSGRPREQWRVQQAVFTAEPLPDSLRDQLREWVPVLLNAYGTGETGLLAHETQQGEGMRLASGEVLVQVCDPGDGTPVRDEREGEVVVSLLRPDYPLLRFGTGDLSGWTLGPDGELRLRGVLGRVGEAVKVRGMFLHPGQARRVLGDVPGLADFRFVIDRRDHKDELSCLVLAQGDADAARLAQEVTARVRDGLRFRADVQVVDDLGEGEGPIRDSRDWD